ncbi:Nif11-like leader peptide family natural product precursor [Elusimicrobiota bacterium]
MSLESAKAFIERLKTDEDFAKKISACKDGKARMELVKAEGFNFSSAEIKEATSGLSAEDLQRVAGGSRGGGPQLTCGYLHVSSGYSFAV